MGGLQGMFALFFLSIFFTFGRLSRAMEAELTLYPRFWMLHASHLIGQKSLVCLALGQKRRRGSKEACSHSKWRTCVRLVR